MFAIISLSGIRFCTRDSGLTSFRLGIIGFFSDPNDEDVEADRLRDKSVDE